jgi:hypothetical protein
MADVAYWPSRQFAWRATMRSLLVVVSTGRRNTLS